MGLARDLLVRAADRLSDVEADRLLAGRLVIQSDGARFVYVGKAMMKDAVGGVVDLRIGRIDRLEVLD